MEDYGDYDDEDMYGGSSPFMTYGGAEGCTNYLIMGIFIGFVLLVVGMMIYNYFSYSDENSEATYEESTEEEETVPASETASAGTTEPFWGRR
jgi:uncharacterized membrane protein